MAIDFTVTVIGEPKGQPRPRAFSRGGHARVYDSGTAEGWKSLIALAVREHIPAEPSTYPFAVVIDYTLTRPQGHFGTGRNAGVLKHSAPAYCTRRPDPDNVAKAVLDALTQCGLWRDDCQVWSLLVQRDWSLAAPGMTLSVYEYPPA